MLCHLIWPQQPSFDIFRREPRRLGRVPVSEANTQTLIWDLLLFIVHSRAVGGGGDAEPLRLCGILISSPWFSILIFEVSFKRCPCYSQRANYNKAECETARLGRWTYRITWYLFSKKTGAVIGKCPGRPMTPKETETLRWFGWILSCRQKFSCPIDVFVGG